MGCCTTLKYRKTNITLFSEAPPSFSMKIHHGTFIRPSDLPFTEVYMLGNRIGKGGFAEVRRCTHKLSGSTRAVKIFSKNALKRGKEEEGNLLIELEILRLLDHPNIIRVYDFFEDETSHYLVMELCEGGELFDIIKKFTRFSESQASHIMKQLFSAVSFMHSFNIAHRDLKPENILVEERGAELNLKLVDFGSAIKFEENNTMEGIVGTTYYMAPELISGKYTEKCDEWSCGVILYILLSGNPPFYGKTDDEIMEKVKLGSYDTTTEEFKDVSEEAIDLIHKLMAPLDTRISANEALNHPWMVVHNSHTVSQHTLLHVIDNLTKFSSQLKLRDAIMTFITCQLLNYREFKHLRRAFSALDNDGDGKIGKSDLIKELAVSHSEHEAKTKAERIIREVDEDQDGFIEFTEYIRAVADEKLVFSKNNLVIAFGLLDKDKNGKISAEELMHAFSEDTDTVDIWRALIVEADQNGDGQIDLDEFLDFLLAKF